MTKYRMLGALTLASSLAWWGLLPAAALAATGPTVTPGSVTLTGSTTHGTLGGVATFSAAAQDPGGTAEYQWWVEEPTGQWVDAQNYSPRATFTLSTPSVGDYLVAVEVLDQGQVASGDWSAAQTTLPHGVFVDSTVTVTSLPTGPVAPGTSITVSARAQHIYDPIYQFWVESPQGAWQQSGAYSASSDYTFTARASGTYHVVAYAKSPLAANNPTGALMSPVSTLAAYGIASHVVVTPASPELVADGVAQDLLTLTVEDASGVRVADYTGTVELTASRPVFAGHSSTTVALAGGSGTVALSVPPADAGPVMLTPDELTPTPTGVGGIGTESQAANITYTGATVTASVPSGTGLALHAAAGTLSANQASSDTVTVTLTDAAGTPVVAALPHTVTVTVAGSGAFTSGGTQTTEDVLIPAGSSSTTVQVWSEPGSPGPITVTAVSSGLLAAVPLELTSYALSTAGALEIASQNGTAANGFPYTLYTVTLVDSQGHPITTGSAASGSIVISDNIATQSGQAIYVQSPQLDYWYGSGLQNGQPSGASDASDAKVTVAAPAVLTGQLTAGQFQFAVENTLEGPAPVSITATADGLSAEALYAFRPGPAAYAVVSGLNEVGDFEYSSTEPGATIPVTAQLTDIYGNPVAAAGQPVWFVLYASSSASGPLAELPNGASAISNIGHGYGQDAYEATTNAAGQATISVTIPANAPTRDGAATTGGVQYLAGYADWFYVGVAAAPQVVGGIPEPALGSGNTAAYYAAYTPAYFLVAPGNAVARFGAPGGVDTSGGVAWPTGQSSARFTAGSTASLELPLLNADGSSVYGASTYLWNYDYSLGYYGYGFEEFILRSSNPAVVQPAADYVHPIAPGTWALYYNSTDGFTNDGSLYLESLQMGQAGSATVTITAAGAPGNPSTTLHVTVLPGPSIGSAAIEYDGAAVTANHPVFLNPNQPVEFTVVNVDAGGNAVPVTSPTVVNLPTAPDGGQWEASPSGAATTQVTIPAGATSTTVWLVSGTSGVVTAIGDGSD
jgi:hypothetical protein